MKKFKLNFLKRIFLEHRELKPLWHFARKLETREDMQGSALLKAHGEKLFSAIDMAINSLNDLSTLLPIIEQLGYSHQKWGVKEEHFTVTIIFKIYFEFSSSSLEYS